MKARDLIPILQRYPDAEVKFIDKSDESMYNTQWLPVILAAYEEDTESILMVD